MNTHKYIDEFKVNDTFVEEAIKKFIFGEHYDKEIIDRIRSLVFCGKNMTTEPLFLNIWTTIIAKFLPAEPVGQVLEDGDSTEQALSEAVN
jgi:hypothetical protein